MENFFFLKSTQFNNKKYLKNFFFKKNTIMLSNYYFILNIINMFNIFKFNIFIFIKWNRFVFITFYKKLFNLVILLKLFQQKYNSLFINILLTLSSYIIYKNCINFFIIISNFFFSSNIILQKLILNFLNSLSNNFLVLLNSFNVFGIFFKFSGKLLGYAGDRKKIFFIKYGKCSLNYINYNTQYYNNFIITKNGIINLKTSLIFS